VAENCATPLLQDKENVKSFFFFLFLRSCKTELEYYKLFSLLCCSEPVAY
jgi:hypothetical protein